MKKLPLPMPLVTLLKKGLDKAPHKKTARRALTGYQIKQEQGKLLVNTFLQHALKKDDAIGVFLHMQLEYDIDNPHQSSKFNVDDISLKIEGTPIDAPDTIGEMIKEALEGTIDLPMAMALIAIFQPHSHEEVTAICEACDIIDSSLIKTVSDEIDTLRAEITERSNAEETGRRLVDEMSEQPDNSYGTPYTPPPEVMDRLAKEQETLPTATYHFQPLFYLALSNQEACEIPAKVFLYAIINGAKALSTTNKDDLSAASRKAKAVIQENGHDFYNITLHMLASIVALFNPKSAFDVARICALLDITIISVDQFTDLESTATLIENIREAWEAVEGITTPQEEESVLKNFPSEESPSLGLPAQNIFTAILRSDEEKLQQALGNPLPTPGDDCLCGEPALSALANTPLTKESITQIYQLTEKGFKAASTDKIKTAAMPLMAGQNSFADLSGRLAALIALTGASTREDIQTVCAAADIQDSDDHPNLISNITGVLLEAHKKATAKTERSEKLGERIIIALQKNDTKDLIAIGASQSKSALASATYQGNSVLYKIATLQESMPTPETAPWVLELIKRGLPTLDLSVEAYVHGIKTAHGDHISNAKIAGTILLLTNPQYIKINLDRYDHRETPESMDEYPLDSTQTLSRLGVAFDLLSREDHETQIHNIHKTAVLALGEQQIEYERLGRKLVKAINNNDSESFQALLRNPKILLAKLKGTGLLQHLATLRLTPSIIPYIDALIEAGMRPLDIEQATDPLSSLKYATIGLPISGQTQADTPESLAAYFSLTTGAQDETLIKAALKTGGASETVAKKVLTLMKKTREAALDLAPEAAAAKARPETGSQTFFEPPETKRMKASSEEELAAAQARPSS